VLTFIDQEIEQRRKRNAAEGKGPLLTPEDIRAAVFKGTSERVRAISMTAIAVIAGLLPIMWGTGTGSEVMQRIAAPMVGGMLTVTVLGLLVLPVLYCLILQRRERRGLPGRAEEYSWGAR
jgi:Cu(I)/Ag(I) efflux system membrane protein CusA/SilA